MLHLHECKTAEEKLKFIEETVLECLPDIGKDEDELIFQTAVVLFAAMVMGTNIDDLTALTGYPAEFVADISIRARSTELWVNEGVCYEHWSLDEDMVKPVAILLDVMVVMGDLTRKREESGAFRYKLVEPS